MAIIGIKHLVYAPITNYTVGSAPTYGAGAILSKITKADKSPNVSDAAFYADDCKVEEDHTVTDGTITIGVADLSQDVQKGIFGNTVETEATIKVLTKAVDDVAPYVGVGYIIPKKVNGSRVFEATWLYRVMFKEPSKSAETKGETLSFQGQEIEGSFSAVEGWKGGAYESTAEFPTEAAAITWLNGKANVSGVAAASAPATQSTGNK